MIANCRELFPMKWRLLFTTFHAARAQRNITIAWIILKVISNCFFLFEIVKRRLLVVFTLYLQLQAFAQPLEFVIIQNVGRLRNIVQQVCAIPLLRASYNLSGTVNLTSFGSFTKPNYPASAKTSLFTIVFLSVCVLVTFGLGCIWSLTIYYRRYEQHRAKKKLREAMARSVQEILSKSPVLVYDSNQRENVTREDEDPTCAICLETFKSGEKLRKLGKNTRRPGLTCIRLWFSLLALLSFDMYWSVAINPSAVSTVQSKYSTEFDTINFLECDARCCWTQSCLHKFSWGCQRTDWEFESMNSDAFFAWDARLVICILAYVANIADIWKTKAGQACFSKGIDRVETPLDLLFNDSFFLFSTLWLSVTDNSDVNYPTFKQWLYLHFELIVFSLSRSRRSKAVITRF